MQSCIYKYFIAIIYLVCPIILIGQESNSIKFTLIEKELKGHWVSSIKQDSKGLMWIGTQDGLFMYDGNTVTPYQYNPLKESLPGSYVRAVAYDQDGLFWLGVNGFGLVSFNPQNNQFKIFKDSENSNSPYSGVIIPKIFINDENTIWFQSEYGIFRKKNKDHSFTQITETSSNLVLEQTKNGEVLITKNNTLFFYNNAKEKLVLVRKDIRINQMVSVHENKILYKTNNEIFLFDIELNTSKQILLPEQILTMSNCVDNICYFLGTSKIYKYNWLKGTIDAYKLYNSNLEPKEINKLYLDKQNVLWLGAKQGLYQENKIGRVFKESIPLHAREIFVDSNAIFIAGRSGFSKYSKTKKAITPIIENVHILAGCKTASGFWLGDDKGKIHFVDNDLNVKLPKRIQNTSENSFSGVYGVVEDANGYIWVGFMGGIHLLNVQGSTLKTFDLEADDKNIKLNTAKYIDKDGTLWVTTVGNGVYKIPEIAKVGSNSKPFEYKNYKHIQGDSNTINSNTVYDIFQDKNGDLWFGTDYGLNKYIDESDNFQPIKKDGSLFNYNIMSINADQSGFLWITTIRDGIFVYDPNENIFYNLTEEDGLISNACLIDSSILFDNILYFGTEDAVQLINPSEFRFPKVESQPLITNFSIIGDAEKDPSIRTYNDDEVNLNYKQTDISVNFSLMDYRFPNKINYYYKLNEIQDNWKKAEQNKVNFIDLQPGNYNLLVKATYNYQLVADAPVSSMKINISPVWYKSLLAYTMYTLLAIALMLILYRFNLNRQLALAEVSKTKELDELKSKMYANISHEFRTPLTIINGLSDMLIKHNTEDNQTQMLKGITNNSNQLLNLVNQMLDLVSLDAKKMKASYKNGDIIQFIEKTIALYKSYSESKQQKLKFEPDVERLIMDFDDDKLQKILNNLLSNAIKFTPEKGAVKVKLQTNKNTITIEVFDTGVGIASNDLSNVFNRYYKTFDLNQNRGSGIGLALTKELVELLKGDVLVESTVGKGTVFKVSLPIHNEAVDTNVIHKIPFIDNTDSVAFNKIHEEGKKKEHSILVVEDNKDISNLIKLLLQDLYNIHTAKNGIEGLKIAKSKPIDFIISDVMMSKMDGLEFCKHVKQDIKTSHIPFIIISARTEAEDRLKARKLGIDAYLPKPFNKEELLLIIKNLLDKKEKHVEYFKTLLNLREITTKHQDVNELDLDLIKKIQEHVLDKSKKQSVDALAKKLLISRTQLHRKIKSLTGLSITNYINHLRIEQSKKLLVETTLHVNEIAYEVGFESVSYYFRLFKKEFGTTPEAFRNNLD